MKRIALVDAVSVCLLIGIACSGCGNGSLVSITVTPVTATILSGSSVQFIATGTSSNKTTSDVTGKVTWTSSNPAVAAITNGGLATGIAA